MKCWFPFISLLVNLLVAWNIKAAIRHADKLYVLFDKTRLLDKLNIIR